MKVYVKEDRPVTTLLAQEQGVRGRDAPAHKQQNVCLLSADAACGEVAFCDEHGAGVYYTYSTAPTQE